MTLNKQALREEFQYMQDHYSDPADRDRQIIYIAAEALLDELEAVEKRIAELEALTVTVKLPELCVGVVQGGHAVMVPYAAGHWFNKTAILEMLAAAGIKIKGE